MVLGSSVSTSLCVTNSNSLNQHILMKCVHVLLISFICSVKVMILTDQMKTSLLLKSKKNMINDFKRKSTQNLMSIYVICMRVFSVSVLYVCLFTHCVSMS